MIPFNNRFHGHSSLGFVYKNGLSFRSRFFVLKVVENKKRKKTRTAVVVSKKVLKSAVRRNRIRRRVYEYIRQDINNYAKSYDIVMIISSAEIYAMPANELKEQLDQIFYQANLEKIS